MNVHLVLAQLVAGDGPPARDALDYLVAAGAGAAVLAAICAFIWKVIELAMAALKARVAALEAHDAKHAADDDKRFERINEKLDGLRDILLGVATTPAKGTQR